MGFQTVISKSEQLPGSLEIHQSILTLSRVISSKISKGAMGICLPRMDFFFNTELGLSPVGVISKAVSNTIRANWSHLCPEAVMSYVDFDAIRTAPEGFLGLRA